MTIIAVPRDTNFIISGRVLSRLFFRQGYNGKFRLYSPKVRRFIHFCDNNEFCVIQMNN